MEMGLEQGNVKKAGFFKLRMSAIYLYITFQKWFLNYTSKWQDCTFISGQKKSLKVLLCKLKT